MFSTETMPINARAECRKPRDPVTSGHVGRFGKKRIMRKENLFPKKFLKTKEINKGGNLGKT